MAPKTAPTTQALQLQPQLEAVEALRKAVAHYKQGEFAAAAVAAASAAERHERCAAAYHLLALALDNLGQRTKAFEMYERALSLDPANATLILDLANAAAKLRMFDGAQKAYRAYLELRPDCPRGISALGLCLLANGNAGEARRIVHGALDAAPESADLWSALGTILTEACDFEGAIAAYGPAQRLAPMTAYAFHNIAHAQSHIGAHDQAIANFSRALELARDEGARTATRHARALSCAAAGRLQEAWSDLEERLNPAFAQATHFAIPAARWDGEDLTGEAEPAAPTRAEPFVDLPSVLLIGEGTFSSAMMLADAARTYDLMTTVGTPTGGLPTSLGELGFWQLPTSRFVVPFCQKKFMRASGDPKDTGPVVPHVLLESEGDLGPDRDEAIRRAVEFLRTANSKRG